MNPGTTRMADKWHRYLPGNYSLYRSLIWEPRGAGKKPCSFGKSDTKQLWLTNGGPALHWPLFLRNVSFTSQIRGKQSNLEFGIAFKQGGRGDGPRILCTNFVGLQLAIYNSLNWKQVLFAERIPKTYNK